ncbi:unnamed protein product [Spodoptera exigua]|nr:unnamed protein product [Spodoptera exigua]
MTANKLRVFFAHGFERADRLPDGIMCRAWWLMVAAVLATAIADEASDPEGLLEPVAARSSFVAAYDRS